MARSWRRNSSLFLLLTSTILFLAQLWNFSFFCKIKCTFLNNYALAFCWKHAYMIQTRGLVAVVCWEHMAFSTIWCWWRRSKHQEQDFSFKQSSKEHKGNLLTGGIFQTTKAALPCVQFYPEGFQIANKKIMALVSRVISFFFIISQSSSTLKIPYKPQCHI